MNSFKWNEDDAWLDKYDLMIEQQERNRIIAFLNRLIIDMEQFNDEANDLKAIVDVLESEDWALGY